eukprot:GHRR01029209.1.p1 GENE.GHRR01029209.1~~GHRR01029209.1.p1  ORF type:complete len:121 (+),score=25.97 GHRR01029209.1:83-445(+)
MTGSATVRQCSCLHDVEARSTYGIDDFPRVLQCIWLDQCQCPARVAQCSVACRPQQHMDLHKEAMQSVSCYICRCGVKLACVSDSPCCSGSLLLWLRAAEECMQLSSITSIADTCIRRSW